MSRKQSEDKSLWEQSAVKLAPVTSHSVSSSDRLSHMVRYRRFRTEMREGRGGGKREIIQSSRDTERLSNFKR
jgi:hypothetical protein